MEREFFAVFWSAVMLAMGVLKTIAEPGGSILMRFNSLQNVENKNYEGKCCDGTSRGCQPCEYKFEIWVTCDGKRNDTDCFHGYSETGIFPRTSRIIFNGTLGNGLQNPLVYNFSLFRGTFGFQVLATDRHGSKINDYTYKTPLYPKIYSKKKWINLIQTAQGLSGSALNLNYSIYCNPHYYGPSCVVGCPPGNNYRCDPNTGNKLCSGGWLGPNCDCRMSSKNTCDATGKKICYRPWYGDNCDVSCKAKDDATGGYTCDADTGDKICLAGWYGNECDQTTPVVGNVSRVASNDTLDTHIPNVNTSTSTPTSEILPSFIVHMSLEQTRIHLERSTLEPFSHALITRIGTNIPLHKTSRAIWATVKAHPVNTRPVLTSNSLFTPLVRTSITRAIDTKHGDRTEELQSLPLTIETTVMVGNPTSLDSKPKSVTERSFENPADKTVTNRNYTEELQSLPLTVEATVTVANPTPLESKPNTVRGGSFEGPAGKTIKNRGHTEELQSLPLTVEATVTVANPTPLGSKPHTVRGGSFEGPAGKTIKNRDHTEKLQSLPLTVEATVTVAKPTPLESKPNTVRGGSFEGPAGKTIKNRDHTEELQSLPLTVEATVTVAKPTLLESKPNTVRGGSFEGLAGKTIKNRDHTEELQSLPPTMEATVMEEHPTPTRSFSLTRTSSLATFTDKPGSSEARKSQQIWWKVLLPFIAIALLVVAGVVIFKTKERKSRRVSPQNEIPLEKIEQRAQDKFRCETDNNNNSSATKMASGAQDEKMKGEVYKVL